MWHWLSVERSGTVSDFLFCSKSQRGVHEIVEALADGNPTWSNITIRGSFIDHATGERVFKALAPSEPMRFSLPGIYVT